MLRAANSLPESNYEQGFETEQKSPDRIVADAKRGVTDIDRRVAEARQLVFGSAEAHAEADLASVHVAESLILEEASGGEVDQAIAIVVAEGLLEESGQRTTSGDNPVNILKNDGLFDEVKRIQAVFERVYPFVPTVVDAMPMTTDILNAHPQIDTESDTQLEFIKAVERELGDPYLAKSDVDPVEFREKLVDPFMGIGINPETGNFDSALMPRSKDDSVNAVHDKVRNGESMTIREGLKSGRDAISTKLDNLELKSDAAYRALSLAELKSHLRTGIVESQRENDEYKESDDGKNNNAGIDWYLGGVARRYGNIILEAPARPDYFQPAFDNGTRLGRGATARHFKTSGSEKPLPLAMVKVLMKDEQTGVYGRYAIEEASHLINKI